MAAANQWELVPGAAVITVAVMAATVVVAIVAATEAVAAAVARAADDAIDPSWSSPSL